MNNRVQKRLHQACENCRRKKTRCPGERPACSTCMRLQQSCQYSRNYELFDKPQRGDRMLEDRLQQLEEKMEMMIEGSLCGSLISFIRTSKSADYDKSCQVRTPRSTLQAPQSRENTESTEQLEVQQDELIIRSTNPLPFSLPAKEIVTEGIALYFKYCHKQPLWLFDPEDISIPGACRSEVIFGMLSLALRYSNNVFLNERTDQLCRYYAEATRSYAMFRIAQGTVDLSTIKSLCLVALAEYIANDTHLVWLHIGLASNLAQCSGIDIEMHEGDFSPVLEERRRVFWSIHVLKQHYAPHSMHLNMLWDIHSPKYMAVNSGSPREMGMKPPQTPQENGAFTSRGGIWVYMVQLATLWSEVQEYVSHCAGGYSTPPWSVDSGYSIIGAHLMDIETKFPTCNRYDSVRFQDQSREELHRDRGYWSPWLYLQFIYHAVHSVLNHPFLYSWRPQQSAQLAVPNTFWKTSSELALIHTTWTVRLIDMIVEKEYEISDPFLCHAVAIAATIHLYYCCAADTTMRESAHRKLETCTRYLSNLATKWPRCQVLHQKIQELTQSAFAVSPRANHHRQARRTLSIDTALMWEILCHNSSQTTSSSPGDGLFDKSFIPPPPKNPNKVTVETEVFHHSARAVDTPDGGQALPPYSSTFDQEASENSENEPWTRSSRTSVDYTGNGGPPQQPLPRDPLGWPGSGFPADMSFMDITHDPFFQFQDHENPYRGVWEVGNL